MTENSAFPLVAVDIGNSRIKLGLFAGLSDIPGQSDIAGHSNIPANSGIPGQSGLPGHSTAGQSGPSLPVPERACSLEVWDADKVSHWLEQAAPAQRSVRQWRISSVNRPVGAAVMDWLQRRPDTDARLLTARDLPLKVALERPDLVGMDRLVGAVAANRLRAPGRPAIVVDVGSAITVDLVTADGQFAGGAILPGIAMSARALHDFTDLLPLVPMSELGVPPPPLGTGTIAAMQSGLYWGAVGAMRELCDRLSAALPAPQIFLTGGAAATVAGLLTGMRNHGAAPAESRQAEYVPHLTLGGIALTAQERPGGGG